MNNLIERERQVYQSLRQTYGLPTTPAQLRQDIEIADNQTAYDFNFLAENEVSLPEVRLPRTDIFAATRIGMYIMQVTDGQEARGILQTYPNATHFADNATPAHLEIFYNGIVTSKVNNTIVYEKFNTRKFRVVPETQESATIVHSMQGWEAGMIPVEPRIILNGNQKNEFSIKVPTFSTAAVAPATPATYSNYLILVLEGFLVSGGSDAHSAGLNRAQVQKHAMADRGFRRPNRY